MSNISEVIRHEDGHHLVMHSYRRQVFLEGLYIIRLTDSSPMATRATAEFRVYC